MTHLNYLIHCDYSHMPGTGDLPGDDRNPNSPNYQEPEFDRSDAISLVSSQMQASALCIEIDELISYVADAEQFLTWVGGETVIPPELRADWLRLEKTSKMLNHLIARQLDALNGELS